MLPEPGAQTSSCTSDTSAAVAFGSSTRAIPCLPPNPAISSRQAAADSYACLVEQCRYDRRLGLAQAPAARRGRRSPRSSVGWSGTQHRGGGQTPRPHGGRPQGHVVDIPQVCPSIPHRPIVRRTQQPPGAPAPLHAAPAAYSRLVALPTAHRLRPPRLPGMPPPRARSRQVLIGHRLQSQHT